MNEEIFGSLLPVLRYRDMADVYAFIRARWVGHLLPRLLPSLVASLLLIPAPISSAFSYPASYQASYSSLHPSPPHALTQPRS